MYTVGIYLSILSVNKMLYKQQTDVIHYKSPQPLVCHCCQLDSAGISLRIIVVAGELCKVRGELL